MTTRSIMLTALAALLLLATTRPVAAEEFTLTVDVPSELGGATYLANQTVLRAQGNYGLGFDGPAEGFPPEANINALVLLEDGSLLFSADAPFDVDGSTFTPRDIVRYAPGGTFSLHTAGGALGLSEAADIDALTRLANGDLVLSFEEPETIGGTPVLSGDLVLLSGGSLSLHQSGVGLGLPEYTNIVGLDWTEAGGWYFMFGEPTTVTATTYLPGQIAHHDGVDVALFFSEVAFPAANASVGLSLPGSPGDVPGLTLDRNGPLVEMTWNASCSTEATDYAVFEGALGNWSSHSEIQCSTGSTTSASVLPADGDRYYLVVPRNGMFEGSYGRNSNSTERPIGVSTCTTPQRLYACS